MAPGRSASDVSRRADPRLAGLDPYLAKALQESLTTPVVIDALADLSGRQKQLLHIIDQEPALNIWELADRMGINRTAVNHHVSLLARRGHVVTTRQGRHLLHFTRWMPVEERKALAALRIGSVRSVVMLTLDHPGISPVELAARANLKPRTIRATLSFLRHSGMAIVDKGSREPAVHLSERMKVICSHWLDPDHLQASPVPLRDAPSRMALVGFFVLSWFGATDA